MHMYTKKCGQNYHFHGSVHSDVNLGGLGKAWGGLGKAWVGTGSELGRNWVGTWVGTLAHDVRFTFPLVELVKKKSGQTTITSLRTRPRMCCGMR